MDLVKWSILSGFNLSALPRRGSRCAIDSDDGGGERRAIAAVLSVNVLNNFFTAFVFEVRVDDEQQQVFVAAACAPTTSASEHSSVIASAA
jgi:hypothetical protein